MGIVPDLFSTLLTNDEKEKLYISQLPSHEELQELFTSAEERELQQTLNTHCDRMNEIVDDFSLQYEAWKKSTQEKNNNNKGRIKSTR